MPSKNRPSRAAPHATHEERADDLIALWDAVGEGDIGNIITVRENLERAFAAVELDTSKWLRSRLENTRAKMECALAALKEMHLERAQREVQLRGFDSYRGVAGKGVRMARQALKEYGAALEDPRK